ncbi:MAG: ATP-dependent RecD-like DNA helicase [Deltaproteobacteria bacterium]|nr:ATP-dependent RecD-like DNA helicase [Deltaproteobacteria bacterium]
MSDVAGTGQITRIVFVNPTNGYTVAHYVPEGSEKVEVVVGVMPAVSEGDLVRIAGRRVVDPKFGNQIRLDHIEPMLPNSADGTRRWLGSGAIPGVGPATAQRLVEFFGDDLLTVLDVYPERLTEVPGIGSKKGEAIARAWHQKVTSRRMLVGLYGMGLGNALSGRLVAQYGENAVRIASENPYRLAREVRGVGFLTADRLARTLGIAQNAPIRIEGGILYYLDQQGGEGHCFVPREVLVEQAAEFLGVDILEVEAVLGRMQQERLIVIETRYGGDDLYTPRLLRCEFDSARHIARLLRSSDDRPQARLRRALEQGISFIRLDLTEEQVQAVWTALCNRCTIITGGPGTGKTTVIKALISALRYLNEEVALCAPTGRAAKRMTETTGVEARTIHRLLEYNPGEGRFQRDADRPIDATAVIVDEVSMIDIELMAALLAALPADTRLILVGDKDQLESVGPGAVLRDLIDSGTVPCIRFTQIHRQAERSLIVVNSHRVLRGEQLSTNSAPGGNPDFFFMERGDPEACSDSIVELVRDRIPSRFRFDPIRDVQVLAPMHKGSLGAQNLNERLQKELNPTGQEMRKGDRAFRRGDRVMQIKNNYDKEVFNGDVGFVDSVAMDKLFVIMSDGRRVVYDDSDLEELVLAYAVTVHKSQGSEYPVVVMPIHTQHYVMLRRNLLYTAMTRGKKLVVVVGTRRAVALAIRNDQTRQRFTRLADRVRELAHYGYSR